MIIDYTSWYCSCHWNKRTSRINSMTRIIEIFLLFEMMFDWKILKNRILYLPTISWENEVQLWWWAQWHQWRCIALLTINFATTRSFWIIFQFVSIVFNFFLKKTAGLHQDLVVLCMCHWCKHQLYLKIVLLPTIKLSNECF